MFKKLVSNLPFNPSLINQVSFYAKRMHAESAMRRTAFIFIALTMVLQMFAVISPPEQTYARPGNDIIPGGVTSIAHTVEWCTTNEEIRVIFQHFGISCDAVRSGSIVSLNSRDHASKLYSLGRQPYQKPGEYPVQIGALTLFMRPLWSWDTGASSTYQAIKGTRSNGAIFYILLNCGNVTIIDEPAPEPPKQEKCPLDQNLLKDDPRCTPCPYDGRIIAGSNSCKPPACPQDPSITIEDAKCKVCPYDNSIIKSNPKCERCPYAGLTGISLKDPACKERCPFNSTIVKDHASCKPCDASQDQDDADACIKRSKKASNTTQKLTNADNTTAQAGDVITYTLTTTNTGKSVYRGYVVQEHIGDLSEYADVIDFHGGTLDKETSWVIWPKQDIPANGSITRQLTVKVKSEIPQTPVSASNPGSGDLTMTNVYGNAINIKLPPKVVKIIETTTTTLPETGPGTSLVIGFFIMTTAGYFFARARLFATELDVIRNEYAAAGGY